MVNDEVFLLVNELGEKNGTLDAARELTSYLEKNGDQCKEDYAKTSRDQRYSSGKIEKVIFKLLAKVVNKQNKNGNALKASRIMSLLGYNSYTERSHRFRQKMENLLKSERKKQKKDTEKKQRKDTEKGSRRHAKSKPSVPSSTDSELYSEGREDTVSTAEAPVLSRSNSIQPSFSSINTNMPLPVTGPLESSATGPNSTAELSDLESAKERVSPIPLSYVSNSCSFGLSTPDVNNAVSMSISEILCRRLDPSPAPLSMGTSFGISGYSYPLYDISMKQDSFGDVRLDMSEPTSVSASSSLYNVFAHLNE